MPSITSAQYFRTLTVLHGALLMGQIVFAGVALALKSTGSFSTDLGEAAPILPIVALAIATVGLAAGHVVFSKRLAALRGAAGLPQKLQGYRGALILRWALVEGPVLFAIVCFLLTGNYLLPALGVLLIAVFIYFRPTLKTALRDLQLPYEEEARLADPQAVVIE